MISDYLILDFSTAALPNVANYIDRPKGRKGTKDEAKIAAQIEAKIAATIDGAGLDLDLCRITGAGVVEPTRTWMALCDDWKSEHKLLEDIVGLIRPNTVLIGFNSLTFDWPLLIRRCLYHRITPPEINLDRYRTPHFDLYDKLTHHGRVDAHALGFYVRRLDWDIPAKELSGEEESKVFETGKWDELAASLRHDAEAIKRLAQWLKVIA